MKVWTQFLIGAIFLFLGLAIHVFKWYFLISGYNMMSKENQARVDTRRLGRMMGTYCYFNGGLFILGGLLQRAGFQSNSLLLLIPFGLSTVYLLIRAQRFDGNLYNEEGRLRQGSAKKLVLPFTLAALALLFVIGLTYAGTRQTQVTYLDHGLQVHGLYGKTYPWVSIEKAKVLNELPKVLSRTGGAAFGPHLKGRYNLEGFGQTTLYVDLRQPPFLLLETEDGPVILNFVSDTKTRQAYEYILEKSDQE